HQGDTASGHFRGQGGCPYKKGAPGGNPGAHLHHASSTIAKTAGISKEPTQKQLEKNAEGARRSDRRAPLHTGKTVLACLICLWPGSSLSGTRNRVSKNLLLPCSPQCTGGGVSGTVSSTSFRPFGETCAGTGVFSRPISSASSTVRT